MRNHHERVVCALEFYRKGKSVFKLFLELFKVSELNKTIGIGGDESQKNLIGKFIRYTNLM